MKRNLKECILKPNIIFDNKLQKFIEDGNGFNVIWIGDGVKRKCVNHKHFDTIEQANRFIERNNYKLVDKLD